MASLNQPKLKHDFISFECLQISPSKLDNIHDFPPTIFLDPITFQESLNRFFLIQFTQDSFDQKICCFEKLFNFPRELIYYVNTLCFCQLPKIKIKRWEIPIPITGRPTPETQPNLI
jgi:hypothetical protein